MLDSITSALEQFPLTNMYKLKKVLLLVAKRYNYAYIKTGEYKDVDAPSIRMGIVGENLEFYMDDQISDYYQRNFKEYFEKNTQEEVKEEQVIEEENLEKISLDVKSLYSKISDEVLEQDDAIKKILVAITKHYDEYENDENSKNILINGNTGVGKTEIFRVLSKLINVPCVVVAATDYSGTGYIGKSASDMIVSLIKQANGDVKKAERGILIIDEIDKLAETNTDHSQVNQKDVQDSLLKILEDGVIEVSVNGVPQIFNAKKLLVIGMGSWTRIDLTPPKVLGFEKKEVKKTYKDLTKEDLINNGMSKDFIGRFPYFVQLNELNYDSLLKILKKKKRY